MPTAREISRQRTELRKQLEKDFRARQRAELAGLRQQLRNARTRRAELRRSVVGRCRDERRALKERAKAAREALRQAVRDARASARTACDNAKAAGKQRALKEIDDALAALHRERAEQLRLRIWTGGKAAKGGPKKAREQRAESDDEVLANLDDYMLRAAWQRVKGKIKAGRRSTRTEAFLQWAHDHPQRVYELSEGALEDSIAELVRDEERQRKALARPVPRAVLEAVPF